MELVPSRGRRMFRKGNVKGCLGIWKKKNGPEGTNENSEEKDDKEGKGKTKKCRGE